MIQCIANIERYVNENVMTIFNEKSLAVFLTWVERVNNPAFYNKYLLYLDQGVARIKRKQSFWFKKRGFQLHSG